jgi:protein-S-isoprenylcysteine O-methyltransferase Ste14
MIIRLPIQSTGSLERSSRHVGVDEPALLAQAGGSVHGSDGGVRRAIGIAFGVGTQLLFAVTVWYLYSFLKGPDGPSSGASNLWIDGALAVLFAVPHSALLHPTTRARLTRLIPQAFYGCFYCVATCCSLLPLFLFWQLDEHIFWQAEGPVRLMIQAAFFASWGALFYSLSLTGLGYQTGWTPWWRWLRNRPAAARGFQPRGAYRWLRHPVYLSFLGLIWFTPLMTLDRLLLAGIWSLYIAIGSWLKDGRLAFYLGDTYRAYQAQVPGYIGIPIGPLARVPMAPRTPTVAQVGEHAVNELRKAA